MRVWRGLVLGLGAAVGFRFPARFLEGFLLLPGLHTSCGRNCCCGSHCWLGCCIVSDGIDLLAGRSGWKSGSCNWWTAPFRLLSRGICYIFVLGNDMCRCRWALENPISGNRSCVATFCGARELRLQPCAFLFRSLQVVFIACDLQAATMPVCGLWCWRGGANLGAGANLGM